MNTILKSPKTSKAKQSSEKDQRECYTEILCVRKRKRQTDEIQRSQQQIRRCTMNELKFAGSFLVSEMHSVDWQTITKNELIVEIWLVSLFLSFGLYDDALAIFIHICSLILKY